MLKCTNIIYIIFSSDSSGTISPPAPPPSILVIYLPWIQQPQLFERIRGFRFSMAAGSQSVESWAKKLDPVQLGKKINFSLDRTLFNSRASPRCWRRLRLRPHTLHQGDCFKETLLDRSTNLGRVGWAQARPASLRAIRLSFSLWNVPFYLPLPGRPPPSAPKMAGIIPLVCITNINVRSSGQMSSLPTISSPLSLLYTLHIDQGKRLFLPSKPYSANTSICLFYEKKSVAKAKVFFKWFFKWFLNAF